MRDNKIKGNNFTNPFTQKKKKSQGGESKLMKMNKVLASLLVFALLVTLVAPSFAGAALVDVNNPDEAAAIERLKDFGIMEGYPDGTFKPENSITRAEFAKLAVVALGLGEAAEISYGSTLFSDVSYDHWASGFINVASSQGIILGFPDGTYRPNDEITYAQALTILVRMIGYGPVLDGKPWPQAYVTKAAEAGITKGVTLSTSADAARGAIARLLNNTLDAKLLEVDSYNAAGEPLYKVSATKTLLTEKLDVDAIKSGDNDKWVVSGTPVVQTTAVIGTTTLTNTEDGATRTFKFADSINPDDYLGLTVKAWEASKGVNKGKIVSVEVVNNPSDVYEGLIKYASTDSKIELVGTKAKFAAADVQGGAVFYLNYVDVTNFLGLTSGLGTQDMADARVVIKDGKIQSVYATAAKNTGVARTMLVKEIRDQIVRDELSGTEVNLKTLKEDIGKKTKRATVVKNGEVATLDDIAKGDVVTRITMAGGNVVHFIVTSNVVAGELASVSGTAAATAKLSVAGSSYELAAYANKYSFDGGKDFNSKTFNDIKDVVGKDVKLILNHVGEVVSLVSDAAKTTYNYAVVVEKIGNVSTADGLKDFVKVFTTAGETVTLAVEDKHAATYAAIPLAGTAMEYELTAAGEIKKNSVKTIASLGNADYTHATAGGAAGTAHFTDTPNKVMSTAGTKLVTSDTVIINVNDPSKPAFVSFANVKGVTAVDNSAVRAVVYEGAIAKIVIIDTAAVSPTVNAIVVGSGIDKDGQTITLFSSKGEVKTYKVVTANIPAAAKNGILVSYSTDTAGKVDGGSIAAVSSFVYSNVKRVVDDVDVTNNVIAYKAINNEKSEIGSKLYLSIHKDVVVYDLTAGKTSPEVISLADINQYNYIWTSNPDANGQTKTIIVMKTEDVAQN